MNKPTRRDGGWNRRILGLLRTLALALAMVLAVAAAVGGTLAYLQHKSNTVTNTFKAGEITYTLDLKPNAKNANEKYTDSEVTMPAKLTAQQSSELSVEFIPIPARPSLTGYTFEGWHYDESCTQGYGDVSDDGAITVSYGDTRDEDSDANEVKITLYAKWTANDNTSYRVEHYKQNLNDDKYTIVPEDTQFLAGTTDAQVTPDVKNYEGFTSPEPETVTIAGNGTTVVEYHYDRNSYTVTLNAGTGVSSVSGADTYRYGASVAIDATVSLGYEWSNWTGDMAPSAEAQQHSFTMPASNVALTANATPIEYTVKYNANDGIGTMADQALAYDTAENLTANAFTRTGYEFLGWSEDSAATAATYADEENVKNLTTVDGDVIVLYAVWKQMDFTVTFDTTVDGILATPAIKTVTYGKAYGELASASRTGYTLDGWTLAEGGSDLVGAGSLVSIAENHTLYAQWEPITYIVKYSNNVDPNDTSVTPPTGTMKDSTFTYDKVGNLTDNAYERTGYTFLGWNTQPDGKGSSYSDGESVTNLTSVKDGVVTLYAQWGVKSCVIRYHANGGSGTMADQVIEWDKLTILSANAFTKDGDYSFGGWATSPNGEAEYLDKQQVVNLQESGTLDLYAKWLLNSYTVTFDYNIGSGTPPAKYVLYGEEYGVLPPYLTTETENLFKGWYTAKEGGERVYPDTVVDRKEDHTLWAHWDPSPANDVIKNLVVHSSADDDNDGVADELHLEFVCSSSFEKFNIPLNNLVPGQKYALTYTTSNNASFGDYHKGYKNARYGSYILPTATEDAGNIDTAVAQDILATWYDREVPSNNLEIDDVATNDAFLNGPWEDRTITFTASASTMYWAWEFGLIEDHVLYDYNIYDISLEPVVPTIEFGNKELILHETSKAQILNDVSGVYATNFVFDGDGFAETMYYPITGLTSGTTYTITFYHKMSGGLINNESYDYGCGISSAAPTKYGSYMKDLGATWISSTQPVFTQLGITQSVTLTFKATGSTAYWVWNMANCSDSTNCTIDVKVTNFSATHASGRSITYYSAASQAALMLASRAESEDQGISLVYDGIDDTYMDAWYPVDEQEPVSGDDYEIAFEPMEGCSISETVTVTIDGVTYTVHTDGRSDGSDGMPSYDPETNVLTIPARLLTEETKTIAVAVSAARIEAVNQASKEEADAE